MGIGASDLRRLIELRRAGHIPDGCSVAEIGAQQLDDSFLASASELEWLRGAFNVKSACPLPNPLAPPPVDGKPRLLGASAPWAREFWTWLGLDYTAIDIDGSPGSIPIDLNYDEIPAIAKGKYQLVTNFGTTEHVVNQLNAFKIIHDLTAPGGVMVHNLPAQGMFNHGLVNYNPKFFWMLGRSNAYKFLHMGFSTLDASEPLPPNIVEYVSGFVSEFSQRVERYRVPDCSLSISMQKVVDTAYVAPIDVNTGARTDDEMLKRRYWTVFEPVAIETLVTLNSKIDAVVAQLATQSEIIDRRLDGVIQQLAEQSEITDRRLDGVIQQLAGQSEITDRRLALVIQQLATQSEVTDHRLDAVIQQLATQAGVADRRLDSVTQQLAAQAAAVDRHLGGITQQLASQAEVSDRRLEALVQQVAAQAQAIDRHLQAVAQQLKVQAEVLDHRLDATVQGFASQSALLNEKLGDVAEQLARSPGRSLWRAIRRGRKRSKPNPQSQ